MENNISALTNTYYNSQYRVQSETVQNVRVEKPQEKIESHISYENAVMDEESMKRFFYLISGIPYETEDKESRWA
jgi:hypothetical protein